MEVGTVSDADGKKSAFERIGQAVGVVVVLGLLAAAGFLAASLFEGPKIHPGPHPSWISTVFTSRGVVGAVRIAIIFAAGYAVISICALIGGRQWLSRVGPLEVAQSVKGIVAEREKLASDLGEARETIDRLEGRLTETTQAYEDAAESLNQLLEHLDRLGNEGSHTA